MLTNGDLRALTIGGGRVGGWREDVYSLVVWAAIGAGDWRDGSPEEDIAILRLRRSSAGRTLALMSPRLNSAPPELVLVAAFNGLRCVTQERLHDAIRDAPDSIPDLSIAATCQIPTAFVLLLRKAT